MTASLRHVQTLCHGCLSADRDLSPIGEFRDMFTMICDTKAQGTKDVYVCWECTAILKRIQLFYKQVNSAQTILKFYLRTKDLQKSVPKSLSKLKRTGTDHDFIRLMERVKPEPGIKPLDKIKAEDDHKEDDHFDSHHNEDEDVNNTEFLDAESIEVDIKSGPNLDIKLNNINSDTRVGQVDPPHDKKKKKRKNIIKKETTFDYTLRYIRISTPDEMCVKEQARRSDLDNLWQQDKYTAKGLKLLSDNEKNREHNSYYGNEHKPHVCVVCHTPYPTLEELESHVTSHIVYRCLVCGHRSPSMAAAGRHVTRHGEIIKCKFCEYCCIKVRHFNTHYKIAHKEFFCDYCGRRSKSKRVIENHITRYHGDYSCKQCSRTYSTYRVLRKHIIDTHVTHPPEETFCVTCDRQFTNRSGFLTHLKSHSAHANEVNRVRKQVKCLVCERVYMKRQNMMLHYRYKHLGKTKYYCQDCDKYFLSSTKLIVHRRCQHEGLGRKRDKICGVCGRGFSMNSILINHMRTHTGERPFACAVCDARFAQKVARDYHQKRHNRNTNK